MDKSEHRKKATERWHSLSGDRVRRDKSGHGKKATEEGVLTNWRPHQEGPSQDTKRKRLNEGDSRTGNSNGKDKSGHEKKATKQWALTFWTWHHEEQVRTRNESDRARGTHILETASEGTSQDTKRKQLSDGHSHP